MINYDIVTRAEDGHFRFDELDEKELQKGKEPRYDEDEETVAMQSLCRGLRQICDVWESQASRMGGKRKAQQLFSRAQLVQVNAFAPKHA